MKNGGGHQSSANIAAKGGRNTNNSPHSGGHSGGGRGGFGRGSRAAVVVRVHKGTSRLASSANYVERRAKPSSVASNSLMRPSLALRRSLHHLLRYRHTEWTRIGTWTPGLQTTSPPTLRS
jgi:hypothetical protein